VNFLLHRELAVRDTGSEIVGVGAMLPDLWRMADRRVRPSRAPIEHTPGEAAERAMLVGIGHHVRADAWFHASPFFVEGERATLSALRGSGASAGRLALFAHVVWEMCLDGALVRRVGHEPLLASLRRGFEAAAGEPSARSVELHHFARVPRGPGEREAFDARMERIVVELSRGPWTQGYQHGDGLAERLGGVRVRLGLPPLSPEDRARIGDALDGLTDRADASVEGLLRASDRPRAE
jgi:hypothetical protein